MKHLFKNSKNSKKASVQLYILFFVFMILITTIVVVIMPFGALLNTELFIGSENIIAGSNESLMSIKDVNVRNSIQNVFNSAKDAGRNNIDVHLQIYRFAWVPILVLTFLVIFLVSRQMVETSSPGGGFN